MKNILPEYEIDSYQRNRKPQILPVKKRFRIKANSANFIGSFNKKASNVLTRFVT